MSLKIYANVESSDFPLGNSSAQFEEIDTSNDTLIFSAGNSVVADQQPIPSDSQLTTAGILLTGIEQTVPHYFLADNSAGILKEIFNMGNQNKRYTLCFSFSAETASEPTLHAFDDDTLTTVDDTCLGAGTPSSSWFRGITTTSGLPGADWVGSRLAGDSDNHYLNLNDGNGPLIGADDLYCNLKIVIPAIQTAGGAEMPVLCVKYASVS